MRIGIDAHVLGRNKGGVERYVEQVVKLLPAVAPQHEYFVFVDRDVYPDLVGDPRPNVHFIRLPASDPLLQRTLVLPWLIRKYRLDAIQVQRVAPWLSGRCRVVLTLHDLIPLKYPERYRGIRNALVRLLTGDSARSAAMILTPTNAVADDIAQHFPGITAPVRVFYNGVDLAQFGAARSGNESSTLARFGIRQPFVLTAGAIEARKNLEALVRALQHLDRNRLPLLVIVGGVRDGAYFNRLKTLISTTGMTERVRFLGFVSNSELADLYRLAEVFVTASWDEGFNIPPLEAMASGTAVLCSDIPVHRELFTRHALLFPPEAPDQLAAAINGLMKDGAAKATLIRSGEACVERFSWAAMAQRMGAFIGEMASGSPRPQETAPRRHSAQPR